MALNQVERFFGGVASWGYAFQIVSVPFHTFSIVWSKDFEAFEGLDSKLEASLPFPLDSESFLSQRFAIARCPWGDSEQRHAISTTVQFWKRPALDSPEGEGLPSSKLMVLLETKKTKVSQIGEQKHLTIQKQLSWFKSKCMFTRTEIRYEKQLEEIGQYIMFKR